jgi:hypothetical protein
MAKLTSIDGGRKTPRAGRRRSLSESEQVYCWRCLKDTGVETSAVMRVRVAPRRAPDGKITGGTEEWCCAHCLTRGIITELLR